MEKQKTVESKRRKFGCLMASLSIKNWNKLHSIIDPEDIYGTKEEGFGKETNPHVTILFGFEDKDGIAERLQEELPIEGPVEVPLVKLSHFSCPDYDVLKFDVESKELSRLNAWCRENFEYKSDYPDYHPHVTLCYLKKGAGEKYDRNMSDPVTTVANKLTYSRPDKTKTRWGIKKEA